MDHFRTVGNNNGLTGVSLDIENDRTLRLFFDLSTFHCAPNTDAIHPFMSRPCVNYPLYPLNSQGINHRS